MTKEILTTPEINHQEVSIEYDYGKTNYYHKVIGKNIYVHNVYFFEHKNGTLFVDHTNEDDWDIKWRYQRFDGWQIEGEGDEDDAYEELDEQLNKWLKGILSEATTTTKPDGLGWYTVTILGEEFSVKDSTQNDQALVEIILGPAKTHKFVCGGGYTGLYEGFLEKLFNLALFYDEDANFIVENDFSDYCNHDFIELKGKNKWF